MIPLYFIEKEYTGFEIVRVGLSGLPLTMHYTLGMIIRDAVKETVKKHGYDVGCVGTIERSKFYEKAMKGYITISTSERQPYGCVILQKGVM